MKRKKTTTTTKENYGIVQKQSRTLFNLCLKFKIVFFPHDMLTASFNE